MVAPWSSMGRSIPPPPSLWLFPFSPMGCAWAALSSLHRFYGDSIELYVPRMGRSIPPQAVSMVAPWSSMGRSIPPPPSLWLFPFSPMGCAWAALSSLHRFYGDSIELYVPRMGRSIPPQAVSMVAPWSSMGRSIPPPPSLWLFPFSPMGCA